MPLHQRHKHLPTLHGTVVGLGVGSGLEHLNLGISKLPPLSVLIFLVLFYFILSYFILISSIFLLRFSLIFS